ncbi:MAG: DUF3027 domain-containing protein, partial [Terrabacter sp.]
SDGRVVSLDHGCGAHSETDVEQPEPSSVGDPIVDEFAVDLEPSEREQAETSRQDQPADEEQGDEQLADEEQADEQRSDEEQSAEQDDAVQVDEPGQHGSDDPVTD